jgi:hypothetical protein
MNWNRKPLMVKCKRTGVQLRILGTRISLTPQKEIDVSRYGKPADLRTRSNIMKLLKRKLITIS